MDTSTAFLQTIASTTEIVSTDIHIIVILGIVLVSIAVLDFVRRFFMFNQR